MSFETDRIAAKKDRVLVVRAPSTDFSYGRYGHMTGFVSHQSPTKAFDTRIYADDCCKVEFSAQCSENTTAFYAYSIHWQNGSLDLQECQDAIKVLAPIARKLERMYDEQGTAATLGQWVARIALAIDAKAIVVYCEKSKLTMDEPWRKFARKDFALAISRIDAMATETLEKVNPQPLAIAA
jgi:hypothetical protein